MDIEAPYLKAIQAIAGKTPGEKQRTIHNIARRIAEAESSKQSFDVESQFADVPEPLKPVIRVEIAKILHQYEGIIEALKSEDMSVVSRALQAKWFFDGSDSRVVNARYFMENVFPEISLYARLKIVKNLGSYLKNTAVAADFFLTLTQQYGVDQAIPLLEACDEDFIFKMIVENKIVLSLRMVEILYRKYPNLVIKYLMQSKPDDAKVRNVYRVNIHKYTTFLPELANNHFEAFMEIYRIHDGLSIKLRNKGAKTFVKTQMDLLVNRPDRYLALVSLELVTRKLPAAAFKKMFKNLFPANEEEFKYYRLNNYLQYYKPEREKINLMLSTFREVYGKDLLSCKDLVDSNLMKALPTNDRITQARLKLEDDKDWHFYNPESSWRCYLPISESIPCITKKAVHSSDMITRGRLLTQLVKTCKINNDKDALLELLKYIYDRHRNDQKSNFYNCLLEISESFDLETLSSAHWEILNKYIKWAEVQDDLREYSNIISRVIEAGIHYCSLNNLPADDYIRIFVDIQIPAYYGSWCILTKYPDLEKKFLDLFIEVIPKQYPPDHEIWKEKEPSITFSIATSLWEFNRRHRSSNDKTKKLSVKDYPWLFEKVKVNAFSRNEGYDVSVDGYIKFLKANERDIYFAELRDLGEFWTFGTDVILDVLKKYPERILENWKECFEEIRSTVHLERQPPLLIVKSRWHQLLPIKFYVESLKAYNDPESCIGSVVILASLADGETYSKIIEQFIPEEGKIDVDNPAAKDSYNTLLSISKNLRILNPPIPLNTIARLCVGDYLSMALRSLISVSYRIPVIKVIPFAITLTNKPVSVMKHGIRLLYLAAPLEQIYTYLSNTWNLQKHTSIRLVVFTKIYDLFCKQPSSQSWQMIQRCLNDLHVDDDEEIFKKLTKLSMVPNEYLHQYIELILSKFKSMEQKSEDPKIYIDFSCKLIANIKWAETRILPEEYCQDLIRNYLFVFDYNSNVFETGMDLAIDSYLMSSQEYDESRLTFFANFFRDSVGKYWNKSHPKYPGFYPLNHMVYKYFSRVCCSASNKNLRIFESLLEIFQSALQPHQDFVSYLDLVYCIEYCKSQSSVDFGTKIAQKIPELIEILSPECVISMSRKFSDFINHREFSKSESNEKKLLSIIEVLVNSGNIHCALFAANILFDNTSKKLNERYAAVVNSLRNFDHPGISCLLNERIAKFDPIKDVNEFQLF